MKCIVELKTNDETKSLVFSNIKFFANSLKCHVSINSRGFGYNGSVAFDNVTKFFTDLEAMSHLSVGSAELSEDYADHYIKLELNTFGHVILSANFDEYSEHSQHLIINFKTDQTCLKPFLDDLRWAMSKNS